MPLEIMYVTLADHKDTVPVRPVSSEQRTVAASSAQSGATPEGVDVAWLYATENARIAYAADPTATATAGANGHFIGAGERLPFRAVAGWKFAAITPA